MSKSKHNIPQAQYEHWKEHGKINSENKKSVVSFLRSEIRKKRKNLEALQSEILDSENEILNLNQDIKLIEDELLIPATNQLRKKK